MYLHSTPPFRFSPIPFHSIPISAFYYYFHSILSTHFDVNWIEFMNLMNKSKQQQSENINMCFSKWCIHGTPLSFANLYFCYLNNNKNAVMKSKCKLYIWAHGNSDTCTSILCWNESIVRANMVFFSQNGIKKSVLNGKIHEIVHLLWNRFQSVW